MLQNTLIRKQDVNHLQLTLRVTITSTSIKGMHVCSMHFSKSSEVDASTQPMKVRMDEKMMRVKKKR